MDRKPIFDCVRDMLGRGFTQDEVDRLDAAIDLALALPDPDEADGGGTANAKRTHYKGIQLITSYEGLRLEAYPDPATGGEPWTIGYGHTEGVQPGDVISKPQAIAFLHDDLRESYEPAVLELCPVTTQNQFDALVSFTYNVGEGNLEYSTLRQKHNAGDYAGAQAEFARWVYANGEQMQGLVNRRDAEAELYGTPDRPTPLRHLRP